MFQNYLAEAHEVNKRNFAQPGQMFKVKSICLVMSFF